MSKDKEADDFWMSLNLHLNKTHGRALTGREFRKLIGEWMGENFRRIAPEIKSDDILDAAYEKQMYYEKEGELFVRSPSEARERRIAVRRHYLNGQRIQLIQQLDKNQKEWDRVEEDCT